MRQAARHEAMMEANLDEYERNKKSSDSWTCLCVFLKASKGTQAYS
jgi:hypothetical protein